MGANFSIGSNGVLLAFFIALAVILFIIAGIRYYFKLQTKAHLREKHLYQNVKKYPELDSFQFSSTLWYLGLAVSLAFTVVLFNWTYRQVDTSSEIVLYDLEADIEIEPPRSTDAPPPPPPPPPPNLIKEVPEEMILEEEEVKFQDMSLDNETEVVAPPTLPAKVKEDKPLPPPPPPPPAEPQAEEIFRVVEEFPRFPGCEDLVASKEEKKACADKKLMEFLYANLEYPNIARENGVEGIVVIQFVVEKDGSISGTHIVKDIGAKCGEEAARVVGLMNTMPKWNPGKQRGMPVRVFFNLPVKFKLAIN